MGLGLSHRRPRLESGEPNFYGGGGGGGGVTQEAIKLATKKRLRFLNWRKLNENHISSKSPAHHCLLDPPCSRNQEHGYISTWKQAGEQYCVVVSVTSPLGSGISIPGLQVRHGAFRSQGPNEGSGSLGMDQET